MSNLTAIIQKITGTATKGQLLTAEERKIYAARIAASYIA